MAKQFEYNLLKKTSEILHKNNLEEAKILLAVSGGVDSMVLLHHMLQLKNKFPKLQLSAAYVHHGKTGLQKTDKFRDQSKKLVQSFSKKNNLPFFTNKVEKIKKNDEEFLRDYRNSFLKEILKKENFNFIGKAHHQDDLLETRLIRLIRGVGSQGLASMSIFDGENLRPLLNWSKEDVLQYAKHFKIKFIEDPSNKNEKYLRNWIRNNWLENLEKYRPGSKSSLARSLETISSYFSEKSDFSDTITKSGIIREKLLPMSKLDQRRVLAHYMNAQNIKNYSHSQIDEIIKRLDSSKKELTFVVAGCKWQVDTRHIAALKA